MDLSLERKLKKRGIKVAYANLDNTDGFVTYVNQQAVIFIANGLLEERENEVVLHELAHLDLDHESICYGDYLTNDRVRTVMESNANAAVLKKTLKDYLATYNLTPAEINPVKFLEHFGFSADLEYTLVQILGS